MAKKPKTIDQNGDVVRMTSSNRRLDTMQDITDASAFTYNAVMNGAVEPDAAKQANSATKIALDVKKVAFTSLRMSDIPKEQLQKFVEKVCLPPQYLQIEKSKQKPRRKKEEASSGSDPA